MRCGVMREWHVAVGVEQASALDENPFRSLVRFDRRGPILGQRRAEIITLGVGLSTPPTTPIVNATATNPLTLKARALLALAT